jgi:hypothetical protein
MSFMYHVQVASERVKEYSELKREPPEYIEPSRQSLGPDKVLSNVKKWTFATQ